MDPMAAAVRAVNVAKFDIPTFESVEADTSLTKEAGAVVGLTAIVGSIGALFSGDNGLWFFIASILIALIGWGVWAWLSAFIAQKVFSKDTTDTGEMARATGYAYAPQMLGVVPIIGPILGFVGMIWSLAAVIVGMRQAGEMTTSQAVITAVIGFLPAIIAMGVVTALLT